MKRRGRSLRRRYGRAGYRIGAGGLERTDSAHVVAGRVYSMGASSSPEMIRVISVTSDHIRYKRAGSYGDQGEKVLERWIGEDLIARGEKTFKSQRGVSTQRWMDMTEAERAAVLAKLYPDTFGPRRGRK